MKVAKAIAEWLLSHDIKHVFAVSGGASLHILHGIHDTPGITYICPQNEQAAGFAADAYARLTGAGCALGTSGPGFTNMVTPITASYQDSVPVLFIAGQVTTARMDPYGTRGYGFQWTPTLDMIRSVTKFCVEPTKAEDVIPALNKCWNAMRSGRKGPALISVPDDVQRAQCT